jgi:hypothetical protein
LYKYQLYNVAILADKVETSMVWYLEDGGDPENSRLILVYCFLRKKCTRPAFEIVYREIGTSEIRRKSYQPNKLAAKVNFRVPLKNEEIGKVLAYLGNNIYIIII